MAKSNSIGYLLLLSMTIFTLFFSGVLNHQREVDIVLTFKSKPKDSLNISLRDKSNQLLKSFSLNSRNSIQKTKNGKYRITFWVDPTYAESVQINSETKAVLKEIKKIEFKNILGTSLLNYSLDPEQSQIEAHFPYIKDPLIYVDYLFVISVLSFLALMSILYKNKIYSGIKYYSIAHKSNIKLTLACTIIVILLLCLNYPKTLSPFSVQIKGQNLQPSSFKLYLDSGSGFNEIEKSYSFIPSIEPSDSKSLVEITNSSQNRIDSSHSNGELFIGQLLINGSSIPLESMTKLGEIELVYNKLFLASGRKISFQQNFQSLLLDTLRHPHSGSISIAQNGQLILNEDLYSPGKSFNNRIIIDGFFSQNKYEESRTVESIVHPHFSYSPIKEMKIESENKLLLDSIEEVNLLASHGTTNTIIERQNGSILIKPNNLDFNKSISNFQILTSILFILLGTYLFFQLILLVKSRWFFKNVELKTLISVLALQTIFFLALISSSWPGVFTLDSFLIFDLRHGFISNYKPLLYSIYLGVISNFSYNLATPQILQILVFSLSISTLVAVGVKNRIHMGWYILALLIFLISPTLPLYLITLWKDIPSSLGMMLIGIILSLMAIYNFNTSLKTYLLFAVLLPLTIVTAGIKHNGFFLPLTVAFVIFSFKLMSKGRIFIYLCSTIILSTFTVSLSSILLESKGHTDFKRLELFPYIVYASYVSWGDYLSEMSKKDARVSEKNISTIAKIEDQIGVDLMFNPNKSNLSASRNQIKKFKKEVLGAILANPYYFFRSIVLSNYVLLNGNGYIWDKGFLPIDDPYRYELDTYSTEMHYPFRKFPENSFGKSILNFYSNLLELKSTSYPIFLCFSYFPQIFMFLFSVLLCRKSRASQMFCTFILLQYVGIFIMPASMEFRYAFFFIPACVVLPLLIGIEREVAKQDNFVARKF